MDFTKNNVLITDDQNKIDEANAKNIPVIGFEHDGIKLSARYIVLDEEALDDAFLEKVYRRTNKLPLYILETNRTYVRELSVDDIDALFELYEKQGITDFIEPLFPYEEELEYEKKYIECVYEFYDYGMWLVFDKDTDKLIGRIGVENREESAEIFTAEQSVELGYIVAPEYQGSGIATEVCKVVIEYMIEEFLITRFTARVNEKNVPSVKVIKKLGFSATDVYADGERIFKLE